ncbi:hypothetical protein HK100_003720 [Physocladia obscura]|uniref:Uncharacterized protein n=1 Tax=Physocladia obscura TaxID=109957 RepID=A0AAD5XGX0_9FUNG|nr:hypothetical protein HK100_003720 [Physocladia obscura]
MQIGGIYLQQDTHNTMQTRETALKRFRLDIHHTLVALDRGDAEWHSGHPQQWGDESEAVAMGGQAVVGTASSPDGRLLAVVDDACRIAMVDVATRRAAASNVPLDGELSSGVLTAKVLHCQSSM